MRTQLYCLLLTLPVLLNCIAIRDRKFYDEQGRQILFHGPNVVVKVPPYMPRTEGFSPINSLSQIDMQMMKDWGFNGMRLGMMWAGVEPTKDTYNETYLQEMVKLVNLAGEKYGIYSLIDFHQDLLAEKFCGDGVPTWLIDQIHGYKTFPMPIERKPIKLNSSGLPSWDNCNRNWGPYYFSDDVGKAFNHLYNHKHHLNKKFTQFWRKVASYFKGNKWVIAYEIINEPFIGDFIRNPLLVIPSVAQRVKFQSFYDKISHSIRQIDPSTPICIQPVTFDNFIPVGFSHAPGGRKYANNSILCYHYYKPPALGVSTMYARIKDGKRLKMASLLSEFHGGVDNVDIISIAEENGQSWLFWDFKDFGKNWGTSSQMFGRFGGLKSAMMAAFHQIGDTAGAATSGIKEEVIIKMSKPIPSQTTSMFNPNGTVVTQTLSALSRTYLQRTAGTMQRTSFSHQSKHFSAVYTAVSGGVSVLYLNKEVNYPRGYSIDVIPKDSCDISTNGNYIEIRYSGVSGGLVKVTVDRL